MSRIKLDWSPIQDVPGLFARLEWHGRMSFGARCPRCYQWHQGRSLEDVAELVCGCGWEPRLAVIALLEKLEEDDVNRD